MTRYGRRFYKLTGSGNDFVFIDARSDPAGTLELPESIGRLCAHGTGIGADGVVFVDQPTDARARFGIRYYNRDGSLALLCGNASLCSVRLAAELGIARQGEDFAFGTGAGLVHGRLGEDGPEIDIQPIANLQADTDFERLPGEQRIGFAMVGVPHLVVQCDDVERVDVVGRGRPLREDPRLRTGANVNFVSRAGAEWVLRTYERGVEAETLACGTGAVATATLLEAWGQSGPSTTLRTQSGLPLRVRLQHLERGTVSPSLNGEGRVVYRGELAE